MACAADDCCASAALRSASAGAPGAGAVAMAATPKSEKRCIKRRSIQSFQRQTQAPAKSNAPREATAYRSPVLMSASQWRCGRYGTSGWPKSAWRRLRASGMPMRTANTPAFSRGRPSIWATSPLAKMRGSVMDCSLALTRTQFASLSASPVSCSQAPPPAWVTQNTASASCHASWVPLDGWICTPAALTWLTRTPACTCTPRACSTAAKRRCTRGLWVGSTVCVAENSEKTGSGPAKPRAWRSARSRYCMASSSSTPPAPAPTTAMRRGPWPARTAPSSASQRWLKDAIGLTLTA